MTAPLAFLPCAARRDPATDNPLMLSFGLHEGTDKAQPIVDAIRARGEAPIIWHNPYGLRHRRPMSIDSIEAARTHAPWIEPWLGSQLEPGDIVYIGSAATPRLYALIAEGRMGDWTAAIVESAQQALNTPGVSLCIDAGFPALRDAGIARECIRRVFALLDEALRVNGARLYLEPRPALDWPELDHYGWISLDEHWERAHASVITRNPRGPGIVVFNAANELAADRDLMAEADQQGLRIALNYTAWTRDIIFEIQDDIADHAGGLGSHNDNDLTGGA